MTSGHGGEEVGGRGKHWRSFLSYLCIIKEHASWERGIKAPQALPWMTWLTAGPKAGLTVARRLGSNSPPTSGRARPLLPPLPTRDPTQSIPSSSLEKNRALLTAGCPGQRLVPWGQGSLHWKRFYRVENIAKNSVWRGGQLLQSVKLGLMMASWCGVIVWRWKMWVVQISLNELPDISWFWKDKQACDGNKVPRITQSWHWVTALNWTQNWKCQILQRLSPCEQMLFNRRVKYVTA